MAESPPILMRWTDDGVLKPVGPHWAKMADAEFVIGESYRIVQVADRSDASHRHFFAAINEAWHNLPESLAAEYPTPEHLRKKSLIKAGFATSRDFPAASHAEAVRLASFLKAGDDYSIITVVGSVVTVWSPKSQSLRAMGKDQFERSKSAVLDIVAGLIGVTRDDLHKESGR